MDSLSSEAISGVNGTCVVAGDKSISHRALMLSSMAEGTTKITGLLPSEDVYSTLNALRALGVNIEMQKQGVVTVNGVGMHGLQTPKRNLDLGNSGTGVRLLMGLISSQQITATFTGDESLSKRPMQRVTIPLSKMGIQIKSNADGLLPVTISGRSSPLPLSYNSPIASAQIKSAILIAGLNARGLTSVSEPRKSRDHTERLLGHFGASVDVMINADGFYSASLMGGVKLKAKDVTIPRDPSSAAFLIVAALITKNSQISLPNIGINPQRTGLITTLREMGGNLEITNLREVGGEEIADIHVSSSSLKGIDVPAERAPSMIDEYPILTIAAAMASSSTSMVNIGELRHKETDRIAVMAKGLRLAGVKVDENDTSMYVHGIGNGKNCSKIKGGFRISSEHDHRIAMSFLTLGLVSDDKIIVDGVSTIETSFPSFVETMNKHGARISRENSKSVFNSP